MNLYIIDLRPTVKFSNEEILIIKTELKNPDNTFIFFSLEENRPYDTINTGLKTFDVPFYQKNCVVLSDILVREHHKINFYNIIRYDSQLMKVAIDEEFNKYNKEINLDTGRFLFLMGKPYKRHRIGALHKLYENNLLDKCDYSFTLHENYYQRIRDILPNLNDKEFRDFVNKTQKKLDDINLIIDGDSYHYMGVPTDSNLYKNTSFSLISETDSIAKPHWFLSEKFWRAVASHHMFILMVNELSIDHIHNLGFSTFQQFLEIKKEQSGENEYLIIDNSIKNVKFLLDTIQNNKDAIQFQIKKNYKTYRQLVEKCRNIVDKELEKYLYISDQNTVQHYISGPNTLKHYKSIRKLMIDEKLKYAIDKLFKDI